MYNRTIYFLNLFQKINLFLFFYIAFMFNAQAEKFVVTGHVYDINEFEYILQKRVNITSMFY